MEHEVPALVFSDHVLETMQLVEFLCDAFLTDGSIANFESRKAVIKQLVRTWKEIFMFERFNPHRFSALSSIGVNSKKDYQNTVLPELQLLDAYFQAKTIKKANPDYTEDHPTLESILLVDITTTILKQLPASFVDYILRGSYTNLISIATDFKKMIDQAVPMREEGRRHFVVLFEPVKVQKEEW
jgi:hypothetical protein